MAGKISWVIMNYHRLKLQKQVSIKIGGPFFKNLFHWSNFDQFHIQFTISNCSREKWIIDIRYYADVELLCNLKANLQNPLCSSTGYLLLTTKNRIWSFYAFEQTFHVFLLYIIIVLYLCFKNCAIQRTKMTFCLEDIFIIVL